MISYRWEWNRSGESCVLFKQIMRCWSHEKETIENTRFKHPMCGHFRYFCILTIRFRSKETSDGGKDILNKGKKKIHHAEIFSFFNLLFGKKASLVIGMQDQSSLTIT